MGLPRARVGLARAAGTLSRRLGRGGGTSLPGKVLLRLQPGAVRELAERLDLGVALVSATNGKTTTTRLCVAALREDGRRPLTNAAGANLMSGVATALLEADTAGPRPDGAVFEVDEAALPALVAELRPRALMLMNLFRDQLDRYGELDRLVEEWRAMVARLPGHTHLILNADDPAVAGLGEQHDRVWTFGIDDAANALPSLPHAADATRCRACGSPLDYALVLVGHMGHWSCPSCGRARPRPDVRVTAARLDGVRGIDLALETPSGAVAARVALPGLHNAYNVAAAAALSSALGVAPASLERAVASTGAAFGRAERIEVGGRELVVLLAKNPAGANETVRTVLLDPGPLDLLIALNDRTADGHDVSWIWDVDYEALAPRARRVVVTGDRAHDMALRLRYGGFDDAVVHVQPEPEDALDAALAGAGDGPVYVLPTYTAMLGIREILVGRGAAGAFWRER